MGLKTPLYPAAQLEMGILIASARVLTTFMGLKEIVTLCHTVAEKMPGFMVQETSKATLEDTVKRGKVLAARASKLVPGSECMHRALATRLWLARRGVDSQIVVGFRKRGAIEGHAWLEVVLANGQLEDVYRSEADGYSRSLDESDMVGTKR